ncbi:hypothetical protein ACFQDF_23140 [Ectobacillus funiculus]
MTNIIDGMDQARFRSAVPNDNQIRNKKIEKENKKMPMVLRNLKTDHKTRHYFLQPSIEET